MAAASKKNSPFFNDKDPDPFGKGEHDADGKLVVDAGKLITKRPVPDGKGDWKFIDTTNAQYLIEGIDWIELRKVKGKTYDYTIFIMGKALDWDTWLQFEDETGDKYVKRIYSHTQNVHTIDYNSKKPNIKKITWEY